MPKPQDDEEDDEHESVDDKREDFTEETCQQRPVDEEPITEDENIPGTTRDNSFRSATPSSSQVSGNKDKFARPKALKRKIPRPEETPQDSPSRQLMAYILAEKEAEKKTASRQDPVDAFLGGIAPSLKSLNPHLLNEAKGRIFAVVQEMELRQLQMNEISQGHLMSNYVTFSSPSSESSSSAPDASPGDGTRNPNESLFFNLESL